jgi:hypothetical protein
MSFNDFCFKGKKCFAIAFLLVFVVVSCKKDKPKPIDEVKEKMQNGILVLNEGLFQLNNSNLSWIDLDDDHVNNQIFEEKTGRQLGDTGNDILVYGSKIYVLTSVSSTIEILDAQTFNSLKQLSIVENGTSQQPRSLTAINGEIYLSTFGGKLWCIDTLTSDVTAKIQVGLNPDQLTNDGNYIYVSNSGGLNTSVYDSTVSIVNPITKTEVKRVTVAKNPGKILVGPDGNIYVITRGNYTTIDPSLHRINKQTLERDTIYPIRALHLASFTANQFVIGYTNTLGKEELGKFNVFTQKIEAMNFIDISNFKTFYAIQYLPKTHQFYLFDAMSYTQSGTMSIYSESGDFLKKYTAGLNPSKAIRF